MYATSLIQHSNSEAETSPSAGSLPLNGWMQDFLSEEVVDAPKLWANHA